jgi:ubiquinone/menaquinone biosynthesis C-methylase UbiE
MTIYTSGNAAKQWILTELHGRFGDSAFRILDLGCGAAGSWKVFLEMHPQSQYMGFDYDKQAIAKGRITYEGTKNAELKEGDAQTLSTETGFDVVTAFSAIEHVVDKPAFLKTVFHALKSGGVAYLNYDDGHFRSNDFKERIMVPVSQLLGMIGIQGPYMKHVDDEQFKSQAEMAGFKVAMLRKHNLYPIKGFMRGASTEAVTAWYEFEERLNSLYKPEELDRIKWSTTLVLQKP